MEEERNEGEGALYECIDVPSTPASKMRALFLHLLFPIQSILFRVEPPCTRPRDFFPVSFLRVRVVKMRKWLSLRYVTVRRNVMSIDRIRSYMHVYCQ